MSERATGEKASNRSTRRAGVVRVSFAVRVRVASGSRRALGPAAAGPRASARKVVRRNEFSSTTEVSKRAGLIAVLSSSRTSVAAVRAGAAAARARARAGGSGVGSSSSSRAVGACRTRATNQSSERRQRRVVGLGRRVMSSPRARRRAPNECARAKGRRVGNRGRRPGTPPAVAGGREARRGGKRAGAHRVALARRGAREGRAHPATRARRADAPPPRRDQCPGGAPTKARKRAADTRATPMNDQSIGDRSKSALVPPVKTVEQVRRSNRSGRAA